MANLYVDSATGSDADNGTTWALAKATLAGVAAIDAPGDHIWVASGHAESTAGSISLNLAGTFASPTWIVGANTAAEPPTSAASVMPTVTTTGTSSITIQAGGWYVGGIHFTAGSGASATSNINLGGSTSWSVYENCKFYLASTGTNSRITLGNAGDVSNRVEWRNVDIRFAASAQGISLVTSFLRWIGGSVAAGGTASAALIQISALTGPIGAHISDVDLSNLTTNATLVAGPVAAQTAIFENCKLPSGWFSSGTLATGTAGYGRAELINCSDGSENYKTLIQDPAGTIRDETTLIMSGANAATDGTTVQSRKMSTVANVSFPAIVLRSNEMRVWMDTTGASKTIDVHILRDSASGLTDAECWIEVRYLGNASFPVGTLATSRAADVFATPATLASSSESWTTTGMANPNKQKASVSVTPQLKGWFGVTIVLAKASTTMYYNHAPVVS